MILYINTVSKEEMIIALRGEGKEVVKKIKVNHNQAEKLLPAIESFLRTKRVGLEDLKKIIVASHGGSFTSLRIGVITANALAFALKIPVEAEEKNGRKNKKFGCYSIVEPDYDRDPNIGAPKSLVF
jgi:tRNA A37 threonylcarbamoyladenosine modification protein TsaB